MVEYIELSKSDRAKCKSCEKNIGKGTPRGVETHYHNNHQEYSYFCYKCSLLRIEHEIIMKKLLKKELNKMVKENKKAIVLGEL